MKHLQFDLVPTELTVNHTTNPIKSVFVQKFKGEKKSLMKFAEPILVKSANKSEVTMSSG